MLSKEPSVSFPPVILLEKNASLDIWLLRIICGYSFARVAMNSNVCDILQTRIVGYMAVICAEGESECDTPGYHGYHSGI